MMAFTAGVLAGSLILHQLSTLPGVGTLWLLPLVPLLLRGRGRIAATLAGCCVGFGAAHLQHLLHAPAPLPPSSVNGMAVIEGRVDSLVDRRASRTAFQFTVTRLEADGIVHHGHWRLELRWYQDPPRVEPGQAWRLRVRLRRVHGFANPGGFDYEGWLYRQGISHTGSVVGGRPLSTRPGNWLDRFRQRISDGIATTVSDQVAAGVLRALVVGDRGGMGQSERRVFQRTGTSHLIAISGLHVGLLAGSIGLLVSLVWRWSPSLCCRLPALHAGALAGCCAAVGYAALAGFSLPTRRALIMLGVAVATLWMRRAGRHWQALAVAMLLVLLLDTGVVHTVGFWLSFGAVALIFARCRRAAGRWRHLLVLQVVIGLGLVPALLFAGFGIPLAGLLLNPPIIVWFGWVVLPAALLGGLLMPLLPAAAVPLLELAAAGISVAYWLLENAARWPGAVLFLHQPSVLALVLAVVGLALLLAPRGFPARCLAPVLILPLWLAPPPRPALADGEFAVTVLDVGQGLAVVAETARHVLVYDTGNRFRSGFNTGSAVVAPFLRARGWSRIDTVIVSHDDNDHAGGLPGLLAELPVGRVLVGEETTRVSLPAARCRAGQAWSWDGVRFEMLYPVADAPRHGNNASCVLRIGTPGHAMLLTGDIESDAERRLLASLSGMKPGSLRARVVTAPHHGSASSSSLPLIGAVDAEFVVYSAGFRNRWGLPRPAVTTRWWSAGARGLSTASSGAIGFVFNRNGQLQGPTRHRLDDRRIWTHIVDGPQVTTSGVSRPQ